MIETEGRRLFSIPIIICFMNEIEILRVMRNEEFQVSCSEFVHCDLYPSQMASANYPSFPPLFMILV
jgi:hypothetical protein